MEPKGDGRDEQDSADALDDAKTTVTATDKIELPKSFEHCDIDHLVVLIADMLERLMKHNDKIPLSPDSLTRFHSRSPPSISVLDYLRRIVKYANVERTCLLITLPYIDLIASLPHLPSFTLSSLTAHRFLIAAIAVASKALCDSFCTNAHYAKVGGIRVGELNVLEKEFLAAIDWRLTSTREVLDAYYVNLVRTHSSGGYILPPSPPDSTQTSPMAPTESSLGSDGETDTSPLITDITSATDAETSHTNGAEEADVEMHEENDEQADTHAVRPKPKKRPSSIAGFEGGDQQRTRPRKDSSSMSSNGEG
ncbi:cyclin-domain-containing protein [Schizopora paradoxa]|uniref:Cyclin-domain-containing protein n=1 Tax=Schizopora paradoxa TaxID=27342 RepID=A0A0H2RU93_9AGAM|nr:cyclin-domain-containing protein [Schizopora paradoxa]